MKNIKITEENYDRYYKFYLIKKGSVDKKYLKPQFLVPVALGISFTIVCPVLLIGYFVIIGAISESICNIITVIYSSIGCTFGTIIVPQLIVNKIKKKYLKTI